MRGFEKLRERAIADAVQALRQRPELGADEIGDLLDDTTLPGFLALLGHGGSPGGDPPAVGRDFLRRTATGAAGEAGVDAADVDRLLTEAFAGRGSAAGGADDDAARRALWAAAVKALERETGVALDDEQRRQLVALVTSGRFFGDAAYSLATVLHAVPGLPVAMVRDVSGSPFRVVRLTAAALWDLRALPSAASAVVNDLLADGDLDQHPAVMVHTMAALFRFSTVASVAATLGQLVHPDNQSVRLAIVGYARANGIPLRDADLDVVRATLLAGDDPDLGPLLALAAERMAEKHGVPQLKRVLARLGTSSVD